MNHPSSLARQQACHVLRHDGGVTDGVVDDPHDRDRKADRATETVGFQRPEHRELGRTRARERVGGPRALGSIALDLHRADNRHLDVHDHTFTDSNFGEIMYPRSYDISSGM